MSKENINLNFFLKKNEGWHLLLNKSIVIIETNN